MLACVSDFMLIYIEEREQNGWVWEQEAFIRRGFFEGNVSEHKMAADKSDHATSSSGIVFV